MSWLLALLNPWTWGMAWRDARPARGRLLLFSTSISLGIAALVATETLGRTLKAAIAQQAKALLGADLILTTRTRFTEDERALFDRLGGERAEETSFSSMLGFPATADGGSTRLVNVRALAGNFPFYGQFETEPASAAQTFRTGDGVLVEENMARQFGATLGTVVKLGEWETHIVGLLRKAPGDSVALSALAPRVYVAASALPKTGLLRGPALARFRAMFRWAPGKNISALVEQERGEFRRLRLEWDTVAKRERDLGRSLEQLNSFLNLVAFIALLLGAVGIASAIQVHLRQRLPSVAVLRCLGADRARAASIYLAQALVLGFTGAMIGVLLGTLIQSAVPRLLENFLPFPITVAFSLVAALQAASIGMLVTLIFALQPLLAIRRVPPLAAIRAAASDEGVDRDPLRWVFHALTGLVVFGLAVSQTRHWYEGAGFAVGLGISFMVLTGTARAVVWMARRFTPVWLPFAWRQGLAGLHRPQNRTTALLVALGLGTFLLVTLQFVRTTLLERLFPNTEALQPNLMLFDIQPDQRASVLALLATNQLPVLDEAPIITMRIKSVNGRSIKELQLDRPRTKKLVSAVPPTTATEEPVEPGRRSRGRGAADNDSRPPGWVLNREYRSTWRTNLTGGERITAGHFVGQVPAGTIPIPVSVEVGIAKDLGIGLGSRFEFDVQGVPIECQVASLREVEWRQVRPNFFVVFPAGALEAAPAMHILATHTSDPTATANFQRDLFRLHSNVSSIDLGLVMETIEGVLSKIGAAIRLMALFTVLTGLIVLTGAIISGRWQRAREGVLLRTLGATRGQIRRILVAEYASLGLLAAVVGLLLATGASWALARWVFGVGFSVPWRDAATALVLVPTLTLALGLLSSRGLATTPPLEILRQET